MDGRFQQRFAPKYGPGPNVLRERKEYAVQANSLVNLFVRYFQLPQVDRKC
jgi:hypothetical protein